jgi:hypothetical protein
MGGGEQYGEQSLAAQWAWEEYQAAMIYRTYERVMVVDAEVAA